MKHHLFVHADLWSSQRNHPNHTMVREIRRIMTTVPTGTCTMFYLLILNIVPTHKTTHIDLEMQCIGKGESHDLLLQSKLHFWLTTLYSNAQHQQHISFPTERWWKRWVNRVIMICAASAGSDVRSIAALHKGPEVTLLLFRGSPQSGYAWFLIPLFIAFDQIWNHSPLTSWVKPTSTHVPCFFTTGQIGGQADSSYGQTKGAL